MKSVTFAAAALSLLQITASQPHRRRHVHELAHQNAKKDADVIVTVVNTVFAEATEVPEVVVYVNQDGTPYSTTTEGFVAVASPSIWSTSPPTTIVPPSASTPEPSSSSIEVAPAASSPAAVENNQVASSSTPAAAEVESAAPVAPTEASTPVPAAAAPTPEATSAAAPAPSSSSDSSSSSSSSSSLSASSGFGFSYSPYNADGTCKTQDQVNQDFKAVASGYSLVRIYGTDCNQVATVLSAAKAHGLKIFAGVFDLGTLSSEIATIVAAANGDWSSFDTISIGNELVNSGMASASQVVAAIGTARGLLKAAGYTGKVVTVDTLVAARANPSLCDASDICTVNCHPFFDGSYAAADSGKFLTEAVPTLRAVLSNKNQQIMISETGWPWKGQANGAAVPSLDNQQAALSSIKSAFASSPEAVVLFTAFNDLWKSNTPAQFQAEQYWGMGGANSPSG